MLQDDVIPVMNRRRTLPGARLRPLARGAARSRPGSRPGMFASWLISLPSTRLMSHRAPRPTKRIPDGVRVHAESGADPLETEEPSSMLIAKPFLDLGVPGPAGAVALPLAPRSCHASQAEVGHGLQENCRHQPLLWTVGRSARPDHGWGDIGNRRARVVNFHDRPPAPTAAP